MSKTASKKSLSYKDAGVDISAGDRLVDRIKHYAKKTHRPEVLAGIGGFGALFEFPAHRYQHPVLVSATDGVGTKLKLAIALKQHESMGIDLVAMCVNDIITQGAEPLFFLDYYATGHLTLEYADAIIKGISLGCEQAGTSLVGGETAEMPGMYRGHDYDLAGFCVGAVEKSQIIDGSDVSAGNVLIALASSGVHANGFSLVRKILELTATDLKAKFNNTTIGDALLIPTRIYVKSILSLLKTIKIHAMAHITGGGIIENLPRVLPTGTHAIIRRNSWQLPPIFDWLQTRGNIADQEMFRTFNCGVGMVICVAQQDTDNCLRLLGDSGETAWVIGEIKPSPASEQPCVVIEP